MSRQEWQYEKEAWRCQNWALQDVIDGNGCMAFLLLAGFHVTRFKLCKSTHALACPAGMPELEQEITQVSELCNVIRMY